MVITLLRVYLEGGRGRNGGVEEWLGHLHEQGFNGGNTTSTQTSKQNKKMVFKIIHGILPTIYTIYNSNAHAHYNDSSYDTEVAVWRVR